MIFRSKITQLGSALSLALVLSSCNSDKAAEIRVRELPEEERELKMVATSAERFRFRAQKASDSAGSVQKTGGPQLVYETPEGWTVLDSAMMRDVNLTFGENGEGECYLTRLPGAGGGLEPNVNRWRKQMGAASLSAEEIAALPKKPLFGQQATFIKVDGNFGGMSGADAKENYRLLGLILSSEAGAVFVKMTGPKDLVEKNKAGFDQFTSTLDVSLN